MKMMNTNEMTVLKMNILGGLNEYIINNGDESLWEDWITLGVPDGATEDDLKEMAEDEEEFINCCVLFVKLLNPSIFKN